MNVNQSATEVEDLPAGAVFHKCALQVNPATYAAFRGTRDLSDPDAHAHAVLERARNLDVSVIAVTNHNDVSGVRAFQKAAEKYGITIFPGFELESSEGVHVLCIYPPGKEIDDLNRYLGEFGITTRGPSSGLSDKGFGELLRLVQKRGGVAIAAHVTGDKGLFRALSGQARIKAWRSNDLIAIQIPGAIDKLENGDRKIVENRDGEHRRSHAAGAKRAVAVVNAQDVSSADDLGKPGATCWIKMSEVSVEALRQAFLDPDSRIRLNTDPDEPKHPEMRRLEWHGGFLDGVAFRLNQNLNVLIGGRGTGKSTIIESIRYVLDQEPLGEVAREAHRGIVRHVLRNGTKIALRVRHYHPVRRDYIIERTVPNPPVVRDENGLETQLSPEDAFRPVEAYGQHEISELARNPQKLTLLLDRFVHRDESWSRREEDLHRELEKSRRSILEIERELQQIEERVMSLPGLEEKMERFREAGIENKLRERSLLVREERVLSSVSDRVDPIRETLVTLREELPIDRQFVSKRALRDLPNEDILVQINGMLGKLSNELEAVAGDFEAALKRADETLGDINARWGARKQSAQVEYEKTLRELQKSKIDGGEFISLQQDIETLRELRDRSTVLHDLLDKQTQGRRELLTELEKIRSEDFQLLRSAARKVSKKLHERVKVSVTFAGDRKPLLDLLREQISGRLVESLTVLSEDANFSVLDLVTLIRKGEGAILERFHIPANQAKSLAAAPSELLMRIEEMDLPSTTSIELNTARSGDTVSWRTLDKLSAGQKATAVLLLLLLESDVPLIIDQPEDDLDNRFITEVVVPTMRKEKRRRQLIYSTHNANIPVLGDAEMILGLTARGEASDGRATIESEHMGSIDEGLVRALVEELLEGGKEAFEKRRMKYGF